MWTKKHAEILRAFFKELDTAKIRFFIDRGYEGLPDDNMSKDVDVIIDPKFSTNAREILLDVFRRHGLTHFCLFYSGDHYVYRAINVEQKIAIHIDLFKGSQKKGIEVNSFDELYAQTVSYNGFRVTNGAYEGVRLFIAKIYGMSKPYFKTEYKEIVTHAWETYPEFAVELKKFIGTKLYKKIEFCLMAHDFDKLMTYSSEINQQLHIYTNRRHLLKNLCGRTNFLFYHLNRISLYYRKYEKSFAVMAPDGAGKTTFLELLLERLAFFYVCAPGDLSMFHIYHHRPEFLPNLGAIGEKTGVMKQDKDFTNPHRGKPVGFFNALLRLIYYWLDYIIGWNFYVPCDVRMTRYTVFDRYSYDLLVDPRRTRISSLPLWIRKVFVACMPHPKITFYIDVEPDEIYRRKQELCPEEIHRQVNMFRSIAAGSNKIITIDGNRPVEQMVDDAIQILLNKYWKRF